MQSIPAIIGVLSCVAVVGCGNQITTQTSKLGENCYAELGSTIVTNDGIQLELLADLEAGDIDQAKKRLMTVLLVSAATMPGILERADNPAELERAADRVASKLLDFVDEELRISPEEARLGTVRIGLAGIKKLVKREEDQKQVSELMIRLYGTDDIDVPFYVK